MGWWTVGSWLLCSCSWFLALSLLVRDYVNLGSCWHVVRVFQDYVIAKALKMRGLRFATVIVCRFGPTVLSWLKAVCKQILWQSEPYRCVVVGSVAQRLVSVNCCVACIACTHVFWCWYKTLILDLLFNLSWAFCLYTSFSSLTVHFILYVLWL